MDIQLLREFIVLVETKNYWEASSRLFIGQSTLSKHIKQMEQELGVPLFNRTSRKVELTRYGKLLIPYAEQITSTQMACMEALRDAREAEQGLLVLGALPAIAQYAVTDLLLEYRARYPGKTVKVLEEDTAPLKEALRARRCELALVRESVAAPTDDADLVKVPYLRDHLVALLPPGHPLGECASVTLRQLEQEDFITLKSNTALYDIMMAACKQAGIVPHVVFSCHNRDAILDLVTQGLGVAILSDRHVQRPRFGKYPNHTEFSIVPIEPRVETQIFLCYRKNAQLSAGARGFLDCMQDFLDRQNADVKK